MVVTIVAPSSNCATRPKRPARQATIRKPVVEQTATNIEILAGAGKAATAEQLTKKLLTFDNPETTRKLLEPHLARAEGENR